MVGPNERPLRGHLGDNADRLFLARILPQAGAPIPERSGRLARGSARRRKYDGEDLLRTALSEDVRSSLDM